MMGDISAVVDMLKDALLRRLGDEVELIFQYGSFLTGAAHQYSDVDISYVPAHESTWESITVMLGHTMIDLYPMHWSHLERMAAYDDLSASVLLQNRILYQRDEEVAERFRGLSKRLLALLQPDARPKMLYKAQHIFQSAAYAYYLLRKEATIGHSMGCVQQAQSILSTVFHCLAVFNQACIDTRKVSQVLGLSRLPEGFAGTVETITHSTQPGELVLACETLLSSTHDLLLREQRQELIHETIYPDEFDSAYPELKADLQRVMLACETGDMFRLKSSLASLYHELSIGIAHVQTGVEYSKFNALSNYEQDLSALGFPSLLPYLERGDFSGLLDQCGAFDQRLREFLLARSVQLNHFKTLEELRSYLDTDNL